MRAHTQQTKMRTKDLADQPVAPYILVLTVDTQVNGMPYRYEEMYSVDRVEDNEDTAVITAYYGNMPVVTFSPDHSYTVINRAYADLYTVEQAAEAARRDLADQARIARDFKRVIEASSGDDVQARYPSPLFTHETLQPEEAPEPPKADEGFDFDTWFKKQMGDE